ncbi:putative quinol monooxygenase [Mycolicibacter sinensis]
MPVVVVATFAVKPESVEAVRDICAKSAAQVHQEPGCQLYAVHETDGAVVFIEQWADADALRAHSTAPAVAELFGNLTEHLDGAPDIKMLQPLPAGDPAKGQLRAQ